MGLFLNLLTSPILGPIRGVHWLATKVTEAVESEILDEGKVRGELMELQIRLEMKEITEEEYEEQERWLVERLNTIRETKAERRQQ